METARELDPLLLRTLALFVPIGIAGGLWAWRRPGRRLAAGALLGSLWNLPALLLLHLLAARFGWWWFEAEDGLLLGMPVDLLLGWAVLWGAAPLLGMPGTPLAIVVLVMAAVDLLLMPLCGPVVRLGEQWLVGEAAGVGLALVPAQLLARWTAEDRRLGGRVVLQVACFGGLLLGVLPAIVLEQTGGSWQALVERPVWLSGLLLQLLAVPALLGLNAVQEFAERGGGTPLPYDPPRRLVTSGVYAYLANPMQLAGALCVVGWGLLLGSGWLAAGGLVGLAYGAGLAAWDEGGDLPRRHGAAWAAYRAAVRPWRPRWRPYQPSSEPARLYVARGCGPCAELGRWLAARGPLGLAIRPAEEHPLGGLTRVRYEPGDGNPPEQGMAAVGRALEHLNLGWASLGFAMRLPGVRQGLQLLVDALAPPYRTPGRSADPGISPGT